MACPACWTGLSYSFSIWFSQDLKHGNLGRFISKVSTCVHIPALGSIVASKRNLFLIHKKMGIQIYRYYYKHYWIPNPTWVRKCFRGNEDLSTCYFRNTMRWIFISFPDSNLTIYSPLASILGDQTVECQPAMA